MKIGIWGSCVTRDIFEIATIPDDQRPDLSYHARSAWASQASRPLDPAPYPVPQRDGFGFRMVREDAVKSILDELVAAAPDIVILDLIDERFDVVEHEGSWFTVNDYVERLELEETLREGATEQVPFSSERRDELFTEGARTLVPKILDALPGVPIVLHQAWWTARSADPERPFYASAPIHIDWVNQRLERHYRDLREEFGDRVLILEPDPDTFLIGDPDHKWGLASFHYTPAYYEEAWRQLQAYLASPDAAAPPLVRPTGEAVADPEPEPDAAAIAAAEAAAAERLAAARAEADRRRPLWKRVAGKLLGRSGR